MIVGEGPGQKEDEVGKPFVGDAGLLLNKMFKAININRQDIYITNVVNYRPPNNRKPEPAEIIALSSPVSPRLDTTLNVLIAVISPSL